MTQLFETYDNAISCQKTLTITLAGLPNVGKSTLLNCLIQKKISIVTHKPQTTRDNIKGIITLNDLQTQLVFLDTPGLVDKQHSTTKLAKLISKNAIIGINQSDIIGFIFDCEKMIMNDIEYQESNNKFILQTVAKRVKINNDIILDNNNVDIKKISESSIITQDIENALENALENDYCKCIAIINKIDILNSKFKQNIKKHHQHKPLIENRCTLEDIVAQIQQYNIFSKIFLVSAINNEGTTDLIDFLALNAKKEPWLFTTNERTDADEVYRIAEITRETIYMHLHEELPYSIKIETDEWQEKDDGSIKISQSIYVLKQSQKAIVLGKNGCMIKKIGQESRMKASVALGKKVHLFLYVCVKEDWINKL